MVASMVRGLLPNLSDRHSSNMQSDEAAPVMFQRQSDVPDPMPSVRHGEQVATLHREWIRITTPAAEQGRSLRQRLGAMVRRIASRFPGSVDQAFIADMIRAIDAVAARCDEISDRLQHQHIVLDDTVTIFGEELTRIRAELAPHVGATGANAPRRPQLHE